MKNVEITRPLIKTFTSPIRKMFLKRFCLEAAKKSCDHTQIYTVEGNMWFFRCQLFPFWCFCLYNRVFSQLLCRVPAQHFKLQIKLVVELHLWGWIIMYTYQPCALFPSCCDESHGKQLLKWITENHNFERINSIHATISLELSTKHAFSPDSMLVMLLRQMTHHL